MKVQGTIQVVGEEDGEKTGPSVDHSFTLSYDDLNIGGAECGALIDLVREAARKEAIKWAQEMRDE